MVLLFRLVDRAVGRWEAIVAVVGLCTFISRRPILQATYTESLAILLVVVTSCSSGPATTGGWPSCSSCSP